jgi:hypothetical protein
MSPLIANQPLSNLLRYKRVEAVCGNKSCPTIRLRNRVGWDYTADSRRHVGV